MLSEDVSAEDEAEQTRALEGTISDDPDEQTASEPHKRGDVGRRGGRS